MRYLSRFLLPFAILLTSYSCLSFGVPETSALWRQHQPNRDLEIYLEEQGYRTTPGLSVSIVGSGKEYDANFHASLVVPHFRGQAEDLLDAYQEILEKDFKAVGMTMPGFGQAGPIPNREWTYSSGDVVGRISARVTALDNDQLVMEVWKSEHN